MGEGNQEAESRQQEAGSYTDAVIPAKAGIHVRSSNVDASESGDDERRVQFLLSAFCCLPAAVAGTS